ncbi:MAG: hypothetical protein GOU98_00120 [Candidatus Altiarchaeota archaeon]|nr:hypothetical protein [Candidatus Altiarchaeota archaeon]
MNSISDVILIGVLSLLIISTANFTLTTNRYFDLVNADTSASITITLLESGCEKCEVLDDVITSIKSEDIKVKVEVKEPFGSIKSRQYVSDFEISRLPAIIIEGEIDKLTLEGFIEKNEALIFETPIAPYFEVSSEEVKGKVTIINIKASSCTDCSDLSVALSFLDQNGVYVEGGIDIEYENASEYITQYEVTRVPSLIILGDIAEYGSIYQTLQSVSKEGTGYIVVQPAAPYFELKTKVTRGLVDITYLGDLACTECYDVSIHDTALGNLGIYLSDKTTYDISDSEGIELIEKYNITKVPTVILTGDLAAYDGFESIWADVGTVESDGTYIFREMDQITGAVFNELE